ncbi:beta-3-deoxy-D-manno-oct-2-ulosonic acid transferase [Cohaesibacter sp. CAU 1516]|uniref:capsular polysaccharide export protein, LipB/KpsS family n=1 Tax=Cohaesibacter sp. CAU 1516 TaxID=2576038 RepID=UPI0010FD822F|nr:beta-3-deoxy-D-manno-oct-2-ulosonic acid transferase [Cohaesibacter sp. CAU 1516]TLP42393.1 beta-3-deoxy-D-manno-oct-2-ulosonic acid transferase [Cohaesibacter sp. CAU 1516]
MTLDLSWQTRPAVIFGLMRWNRNAVRAMLSDLPGEPIFARSFAVALRQAKDRHASLFAWASRLDQAQHQACHAAGIPLVLIEDGFIRSVGLGAAFVPAASLIFDGQGIYYDPSRPSDLEWMLKHQDVTPEERERGAEVRRLLVDAAVSKYNLGNQSSQMLDLPGDREIILVPGQVSDDASILTNRSQSLDFATGSNPNRLLLERVRQDNPDAFILYKPHPDVQSGLRNGALTAQQLADLTDLVVPEEDILSLIDLCDKVETISSLTGFEALLRHKAVVVHGLPFYCGWELTEDRTICDRRGRKRDLDELVFLTLCRYPRYADLTINGAAECEAVIRSLAEARKNKRSGLVGKLSLFVAQIAYRLNL